MALQKNYKLISNLTEALSAISKLKKDAERGKDIISFDLETNSLVEKTAKVIGIGLTNEIDEGYYICTRKWNGSELESVFNEKDENLIVEAINNLFSTAVMIGHNLCYDVAVWKWFYGTDLTDSIEADTMLMKHTIDSERPFGLKDCAIKYQAEIGIPDDEVANQEQLDLKESVLKNGGKWIKKEKDIYKGDWDKIGTYCIADVDLSLRLYDYFQQILEEKNLDEFFYDKEVMPLYKLVTIPMKLGGLNIDVDYFNRLKKDVERDIVTLTKQVFNDITDDIKPLVESVLEKEILVSRKGIFAEELLKYYSLNVPLTPSGKPSFAKKHIQHLEALYPDNLAVQWLAWTPKFEDIIEDGKVIGKVEINLHTEPKLPKNIVFEVSHIAYLRKKPQLPYIFNLASKDHLSWLLFECYGLQPKSYSRKTGKPQVDKASLDLYRGDHPFLDKLLELNRLEKLLSSYIKPILENEIDGIMYPSFLQHGTTSGRYSSGGGGINFQTLPRDDTRIKKGFIAPEGYKIVAADFSSLEPRIFSAVSKDPGLIAVYKNNLDLYSQVAIDINNLQNVSANPDADNYLKKIMPEERNRIKTLALSVVYGASAGRISSMLNVEYMEAQKIIDSYLDTYPNLRDYMETQFNLAITKGYVKTEFGRIRRLDKAKDLWARYGKLILNKRALIDLLGEEFGVKYFYEFKNLINNSRNFPIQATAAHVTNAASIKLAKAIKTLGLDARIMLNVHDELILLVKEDIADKVAELLSSCMEKNEVTKRIAVPMVAEPIICDNLADAK